MDVIQAQHLLSLWMNVQAFTKNRISQPLVSVYPNPGEGVYMVDVYSENQDVSILVINSFGQFILSAILSEKKNTIDLTPQNSGIYHFIIKSMKSVDVIKVAKY